MTRTLRSSIRLIGALATVTLTAASCDDTGPGSGSAIAWSTPLATAGDDWIGRPAAANGIVVIQDGPALRGLDAATGTERWRRQLRQGVSVNAASIVINSGRVYAAGGDSVYAVALTDGARLWAFLPDAQAALCEPSADSAAVYVGTRSHKVYALGSQTGQVLWSVDVGSTWQYTGIVVGTAVTGDTVYAAVVQYLNLSGGLRAGHIIALDRSTGAPLWDYSTPGQRSDVAGAPGIENGLVVAGNEYGPGFFAVNRASGQQAWSVTTAAAFPGVFSTPAFLGARVFAAAQGGVYAVDLVAGTNVWKREDILAARDAQICNGRLVVQNQSILTLDPTTGSTVGGPLVNGNSEFPTSRLVVAGNYAFVVSLNNVYAIRC
jgi:outer membrane protein assembly factor BamB